MPGGIYFLHIFEICGVIHIGHYDWLSSENVKSAVTKYSLNSHKKKQTNLFRDPIEAYFLAETVLSFLAKRDFLLLAAFLCRTPLATALSITE